VAATLAELRATHVAIAYDQDTKPKTVETVAAAEQKLAHLVRDTGCQVAQWTWSAEEAKGIDDLLASGLCPFPIPHPMLTQWQVAEEPSPELGEEYDELRAQRDAAVFANRARARIQRNTNLPARPMATVLAGAFANAATASRPAGDYEGTLPPGFVAAPVRELAIDAGCKPGNAGQQLKALEAAGLIARRSVREILPAGQIDPETGERVDTPRVFSKHFIAIAGHEHEPVTPALFRALVDRMAAYDPGTPEKRGGKRIPRCPKHPEADVLKDWSAYCSICHEELASGEADPVPPMLLEPLDPRFRAKNGAKPSHDQSLIVRDGVQADPDDTAGIVVDTPHDQSLITREDAPTRIVQHTPRERDSLGIRPIAHKVHQRDASVDQRLIARRQRAYADLSRLHGRSANGHADATTPPDANDDELPPLTLFALPPIGCARCGAAVAEGRLFCRTCDPRSA
jgi:hypothetical protein